MKKLLILISFFCVSLIQVFPCFAQNNLTVPQKIRVVTSFYPMHIMALNVFKNVENIQLVNMAPPTTGCLHDYPLNPADMIKLEKADIFIANGAGMESFLLTIAKKYPHIKIVELAEGIPLLKNNNEINPHVWVSIEYAITEVKNLAKFMAKVNAPNATRYEKNELEYIGKLQTLRDEMHASLDVFKGTPIVTFHEAFPYFAKEFGLKIAGVIEREPGSSPNPKELTDTINSIRLLKVKALFSEPQYPVSAAKIIAKESGVHIYELDPAVTGPDTTDAYINIMQKNLNILKEALK